jgi:DNA-binding CsgD family transcriptional regulator
MMNTTFSTLDVAALLRIAGEVRELGQDLHQRRVHILNRLLGLVGGYVAFCSEVDPRFARAGGWAFPGSVALAGPLSFDDRSFVDRYLTGQLSALDPCIPLLLQKEKPVVTARRMDLVGHAWYGTAHFNEIRRPLRFGESLYGILRYPDGRLLKLSMHREWNDPPFSERDVQLVHVFNENLACLYIAAPCAQLTHDQPARPDARIETLPPRLRPVLRRLLAGDAEKEAALKLGLSPHTIHEYAKLLYRTYSVNSRSELLAQFVGFANQDPHSIASLQ